MHCTNRKPGPQLPEPQRAERARRLRDSSTSESRTISHSSDTRPIVSVAVASDCEAVWNDCGSMLLVLFLAALFALCRGIAIVLLVAAVELEQIIAVLAHLHAATGEFLGQGATQKTAVFLQHLHPRPFGGRTFHDDSAAFFHCARPKR